MQMEEKDTVDEAKVGTPEAQEGFGEKDISFLGGFTLLANNITGPAMVAIPLVYQQAGFITPTMTMLFIMAVSSLSATMLCRAMALIPGNDNFQERHELVSLAKYYFPRWGYYVTLLLFILSLQAVNIASIIESAQTMDLALLAMFKYTGGLEAYPHPGWTGAHEPPGPCDPSLFSTAYIVTIGFVIVMAISIPLGYFNLDDNVIVQECAFFAMIAIIIEWMVAFFSKPLNWDNVPAVGRNQTQVLGTLIFNYAFVTTVPSWVNEKRKDVSVNKTIWAATGVSTILFMIVGWLGALAFHLPNDGSENILQALNSGSTGPLHVISQITVYLFPAVVLLSGIPVASIIIRYNLIQSGLCGKAVANFWAVIFPWLVAAIFYTGSGLQTIINWTSLGVNGVINFLIPLTLYIMAERNAAVRHSESAPSKVELTEDMADTDDPGPDFDALPRWKWMPRPILVTQILIGVMVVLILATIVLDILVVADPSIIADEGPDDDPCSNGTAANVTRAFVASQRIARRFQFYAPRFVE